MQAKKPAHKDPMTDETSYVNDLEQTIRHMMVGGGTPQVANWVGPSVTATAYSPATYTAARTALTT